jgi:predicted nuclease of predicted toxin-antitoxin system
VKFKLDENLGRRCADILGTAGHDVATVASERIQSIADSELIERCRSEKRCLVTLDLGFANPLTFLPSRFAGIAVLRLLDKPAHVDVARLVQTLTEAVAREEIAGKLWIVEIGRVRVYQEESEEAG